MDIPLHSLAFHVYPDLYYNIGLLKANKTCNHSKRLINTKTCLTSGTIVSVCINLSFHLCKNKSIKFNRREMYDTKKD